MRDLTEEERALAPEWAYYYDFFGGKLVFMSKDKNTKGLYMFSHEGYNLYWANEKTHPLCETLIIRKPFNIAQHEWSDERLSHDGDTLNVEHESCGSQLDSYEVEFLNLQLRKKDAIAIAKHFKLTAEDLK